MGRLIEGLWDCPYCSTKGIGGSKRECPNCGRPRGEETKFYMPGKKTYVSEEKASKINRNPDWLCMYCGSLNSDSNSTCKSCGSLRVSENKNYFSMREDKNSTYHDSEDSFEDEQGDDYDEKQFSNNENNSWEKKESVFNKIKNFFKDKWKILLIGLLIILFVVGLIFLLTPKTKEVTITGFEWERSISIERYQTVNESGWELPSGGRLKATKEEIYTYESVLDHYETKSREVTKQEIVGYDEYVVGYRDLGNGYFEEITEKTPIYKTYTDIEYYEEPVYKQVPIYKTKYYYEIDKWLFDRKLKTSGKNKDPYWESISSLTSDERESERKEKYYIVGFDRKNEDKTERISVPFEIWNDLNTDQTVKLKVSLFGEGELIE